MAFNCSTFERGYPGYEEARCKAVWNGYKPERYPEIIVQAKDAQDVVDAIQYASRNAMKVGVRSGGHSWSASFLRDDGMLIDVSRLNDIEYDPATATAMVGPGTHGGSLNRVLKDHGLMFPGGHCPTVGLGGYILQGGYGWNSRLYGMGCENVSAVDVVLPNGQLVHANANSYSDLYWAARGAGHGFFGVVTRFFLHCHPLPCSIMTSCFWLSMSSLDELVASLDQYYDSFPRHLEALLFIAKDQHNIPGLTIRVQADALATSRTEAIQTLNDFAERLPILSKALESDHCREGGLDALLEDAGAMIEVADHKFIVDGVWMNDPIRTILPQIHTVMADYPPSPAHLFLQYFNRNDHLLPDMAYSLEGKVYVSTVMILKDTAQYVEWDQRQPHAIEPIARKGVGCQLADENFARRPAQFMAVDNFLRLERIRRKYDPARMFHGFMGLTEEFKLLEARVQSEEVL